jgi:hypothetical protein
VNTQPRQQSESTNEDEEEPDSVRDHRPFAEGVRDLCAAIDGMQKHSSYRHNNEADAEKMNNFVEVVTHDAPVF